MVWWRPAWRHVHVVRLGGGADLSCRLCQRNLRQDFGSLSDLWKFGVVYRLAVLFSGQQLTGSYEALNGVLEPLKLECYSNLCARGSPRCWLGIVLLCVSKDALAADCRNSTTSGKLAGLWGSRSWEPCWKFFLFYGDQTRETRYGEGGLVVISTLSGPSRDF